MSLPAAEFRDGAKTTWDWKNEYIQRLDNGEGNELFSQASVTPDTTLLLAGPPRLNDGFSDVLSPIGLVTDVTFSSDNGLRPTWEIGTDMTYFTRGKVSYQLSIGAMIANKSSLLKILTRQSPVSDADVEVKKASHTGSFWSDIDTDNTASPFGILMIFKTKGGGSIDGPEVVNSSSAQYDSRMYSDPNFRNSQEFKDSQTTSIPKGHVKGDILSAVYLENCNIANFSFGISSQAVTVDENVSIMFDRMVAVDYETGGDDGQ